MTKETKVILSENEILQLISQHIKSKGYDIIGEVQIQIKQSLQATALISETTED